MEPSDIKDGSQGPIVGIVIVIALLIAGGFYIMNQLSLQNAASPETATTTGDAAFAPTATSDAPDAIANDLDAENFDSLDTGLNQLDAEVNQ